MGTVFPVQLDNFTNPSPASNLDTPGVLHDDQHENANDAIEALELKVGINGSTDPASLEYRLSQLGTGLPFKLVSSYAGSGATRVQAAVDALPAGGGIVLVDYVGTLTIPPLVVKPNVTLRGLGEYVTFLQVANGANAAVINSQFPGQATGLVVEDMTLDGNGPNQTASGWCIVTVSSFRTRVNRVRIMNSRDAGIYHYQGGDHEVAHCHFDGCGTNTTAVGTANGITLLSVAGAKVHHNVITDVWDFGVGLLNTGSSDIHIHNNTIIGTGRGANSGVSNGGAGGIGIAVGNSNTNLHISENTVTDGTGNGIDFGGCSHLTIRDNVIDDCNAGIIGDTAAVAVGTRIGVTITGNTVRNLTNFLGVGAYGIALGGSPRTIDGTVSGNLVADCPSIGILLVNSDNNAIGLNVVKNCGTAAAGPGSGQSGIHLLNSTGNTVTGNRCYDDRASKFQHYGVEESGTSNRNAVVGNILHGNLTGAKLLVGAQSIAASNIET